MYGGAKGGAKTFLGCVFVDAWVSHLIELFGLKPSSNPVPLGFFGRKRSKDFHETTLETFKRIIPADHYRLHDNESEMIFGEAAKVFIGGLDNQERIKKFNSAEFAFFVLDQAEEAERGDVDVLQAALRFKMNGVTPPYKAFYTANPADCWLREDFIVNPVKGNVFIPALYTDNPHLPPDYGDRLEKAFRYNQPLLRAYKYGDWFALEAANVLITDLMLSKLKDVTLYPKVTRGLVSCDPSLGGDECVIYHLENTRVTEELILHERDPMKIAGHMQVLANRKGTANYATDTTGGLGEAINARIRELNPKANVQSINSSEKAVDAEHRANVRTEMWWYAMTQIQDQLVDYPKDEELRRQLTAPRFKVVNSNGKVALEPKDETKKRLGQSPDRADAYVIGLYAIARTEPLKKKDVWDEDEEGSGEVASQVTGAMTA